MKAFNYQSEQEGDNVLLMNLYVLHLSNAVPIKRYLDVISYCSLKLKGV